MNTSISENQGCSLHSRVYHPTRDGLGTDHHRRTAGVRDVQLQHHPIRLERCAGRPDIRRHPLGNHPGPGFLRDRLCGYRPVVHPGTGTGGADRSLVPVRCLDPGSGDERNPNLVGCGSSDRKPPKPEQRGDQHHHPDQDRAGIRCHHGAVDPGIDHRDFLGQRREIVQPG